MLALLVFVSVDVCTVYLYVCLAEGIYEYRMSLRLSIEGCL